MACTAAACPYEYSNCIRLLSLVWFFKIFVCLEHAYRGNDAVTDNSVVLNVNIVNESINGCNDVYLTCCHFSDVSA